MAKVARLKPALMRFEGPMYSDNSGPQIVVEYSQGGDIIKEPYVVLDPDASEGGRFVYMKNVPWLVETLQRILKETA
jgi:hypothetical protein